MPQRVVVSSGYAGSSTGLSHPDGGKEPTSEPDEASSGMEAHVAPGSTYGESGFGSVEAARHLCPAMQGCDGCSILRQCAWCTGAGGTGG